MKHITFEEMPSTSGKTQVVHCISAINQGEFLGSIKWYNPWRKYCFFPSPTTVFDLGCLTEIGIKIRNLMDAKNEKNKVIDL